MFYFFFETLIWGDFFFFFLLSWLVLWEAAVGYVPVMDAAAGTLPEAGEKGAAGSVSAGSLGLRGPVVPEEYGCTGGMRKLF